MRKIIIAVACVTLLGGPAFSQTSQPQGGASQSPTSEMSKGGTKKGKSTTGMSGKTSQKMQKEGPKYQAPKY
ncbi:hypothetical protein [Bradyrhizobium sp. SYSU BS000235]|uniref:hypothetical protein n=1 Tax=Bradyrhizobium sp. SYSU BS000235 TaxID=3411332 RepID=UPI003C773B14